MSRQATRLGDLCTGHGCFPSRPNDTASPNFYINSLPSHRQNDHWVTHCCGNSCHDGYLVFGSNTFYVNSRQQARVGDFISCGSTVMTGSPNTFVGI